MDSEDSSAIGTPNAIFLRNIIATVFGLTLDSWAKVLAHVEVNANCDEPFMAGCLVRAMILEKRRCGLSTFRIEDEVGTRSSPEVPKPDGRIDIKIIYSFDESEYFGMECKRVSGESSELARKYVKDGVTRFVSGKYSPSHQWASMVGFVIDSDTAGAIKLVQSYLSKLAKEVEVIGEWQRAKQPRLKRPLYLTAHKQQYSRSELTIFHLFLPLT